MANQVFSSSRLALAAGLLALGLTGAHAAPEPTAAERTPDARHAGEPREYAFQTLDFPGAALTIVWGLDDFGDMAGQYAMPGGVSHAMTIHHGKFKALDPARLGTGFSAAGGPTDLGETFGGYTDDAGVQHGFVIRGDRFERVDFRGHVNANIDGMDISGSYVAVYWDADKIYHGMLGRHGNEIPFDVDGARDTYPLGLNVAGESVGYWDIDGVTTHGYLRHANGRVEVLDMPGAAATVAFAVNDCGQVAGYYTERSGALHGFVRTGATFRQIDMPGAVATIVTTINNRDSVAGEYFDAAGVRHGFVANLK